MKLLIIFNPKAAFGRSTNHLTEIQTNFRKRGIGTHFETTSYPGHARELVANADLSDFDGVVAAGGDGTLFEVLNGLYAQPETVRVPLGVLPIGTGNAFSREIKTEQVTLSGAIDILEHGNTRLIDVAQVKTADKSYYFLNIIHMGFSVEAGLFAKKLKFLGKAAYTLATLWQVLKLKSYPLKMETDGVSQQSDNIFISIANTRYTGTHFLIAPQAIADDGLLDVISLRKLSRLRILKLFPTIYEGRHIEYEEVTSTRARQIKLIAPEAMLLGPDGEFYGHTPAEITCLHRDLTVFCQ